MRLIDTPTDYISRQAAIDTLFELYEYQRNIDPTAAADLVRQGVLLSEKRIERLPSAQPEIIRCKECKHFHYDMPYVIQGIPVLGHEVCDFWGDGCKTSENGFCSYAERRTDE